MEILYVSSTNKSVMSFELLFSDTLSICAIVFAFVLGVITTTVFFCE